MTVVFLIYGLAFFVLGITIILYPRKGSSFRLAGNIWLIGAFGIFHGINEWVDMFILMNSSEYSLVLKIVRTVLLPFSFVFLFQFGLSGITRTRTVSVVLKTVPFVIVCILVIIAVSSRQWFLLVDIWARYLLGAPGILLTAYALFVHEKEIRAVGLLRTRRFFRVSEGSFFLYGVFAGLVVPEAGFFPASVVNYSAFYETFGVPVQVLRSFCAVAIVFGVIHVLKIFDVETKESLRKARDELEERVDMRTRALAETNKELEFEIAERRQAEEFVENILETVEEGFIVLNRDFQIVSANRAFRNQMKRPAEDIIGKDCYHVSHCADRPCHEAGEDCPVKRTFETGEPHESVHIYRDSTGDSIYVELKSYPVKSVSGKITGAIETVNDITERIRLEDQLRQAQKMEAVGQLAGGVAHDFNNILTAIIGYASLLQTKMADDDQLRVNVDQILSSANKAATLTHNLLAYSRKQIIRQQPVDMNEAVEHVRELLLRIIGEDIELKTVMGDEKLIVFADRNLIEQVLMNLATNARDAMPDVGSLMIGTSRFEMDDEYVQTHGFGEPGRYVLMSVSDTGEGMEKEAQEKIFEPFFTTKEVGKGTGLGMAMVYGIIKQHNGYVLVYSETGKGTTFKIYLPMISSEVEEDVPSAHIRPAKGTETILVAEDDEGIRQLIKSVLEDAGYTVITSVDGKEAVEKYMEHKDAIHLLLLDIVMPRKSGKDAYEEVKKENPDMKVLFMSGYTSAFIHENGVLTRGVNFVYKPISPNELLRKLRDILYE